VPTRRNTPFRQIDPLRGGQEHIRIIHMSDPSQQSRQIVLASASETRAMLLRAAGLIITTAAARVDEDSIRLSLSDEGTKPRDIADALADAKARKVAQRFPDAVVIGCDQVLDFAGQAWGKAETADAARAQLQTLRGQAHLLHSAVVLYDGSRPIWRHIGEVRLTMRKFSDAFLDDYLARNWDAARDSVGTYRIEEEGIRLFSRVDGDHFTVLGLPLLPVLSYLGDRGFIPA
jgi:septum formation protein